MLKLSTGLWYPITLVYTRHLLRRFSFSLRISSRCCVLMFIRFYIVSNYVFIAFRAVFMFPVEVTVYRANTENRCYGNIRQPKSAKNFFYKLLAGLRRTDFFPHIQV